MISILILSWFGAMASSVDRISITKIVREQMQRTPAWVRSDLASHDPALRERAEDVLAAMISAALLSGPDGKDIGDYPDTETGMS